VGRGEGDYRGGGLAGQKIPLQLPAKLIR
jgi:hypothetical protein